MSNGIQLKDMLKAFSYVKTQSGPVTPARTTSVDMMKGTFGPVGDQTDDKKWDRRKYENDNLEMHKNYLSLSDIRIKVLTEATSSTSYSPMRLNLSGVDLDTCSMNGTFNCDGQNVVMNMKFPNKNGDITVELTLDSGNNLAYDVSLDSDQFKGNFAQSIRESARNLINKATKPSGMDEMLYGVGSLSTPQNNFNDTLGLANSDTNNITAYESVDWRLRKLLDVCNEADAMFEAGEDFGAEDFAAPGDPAGDQGAGAGAPPPPPMGGGDGTEHPQDAGDINGVTEGNGKGAEEMEFREFVLPTDPSNGPGLSQAAWDNMAQIVADATNYAISNQSGGVKPSANEWYEGFPGVKDMTSDELLEQFLSFDDYKALDTTLPIEGLQQFAKALEGGKIDITKFKTDLGKWFPGVYNSDGTAMRDVAKETAAMIFPQDDQTGVGQGMDMNSTVDFGNYGDTADMMDKSIDMFGGANNTDPGIDMSENGSASEEPGQDKTDLAINSLDNLF